MSIAEAFENQSKGEDRKKEKDIFLAVKLWLHLIFKFALFFSPGQRLSLVSVVKSN